MEVEISNKDNEKIINFHCPRFNELPHVPLYKDQVISYIEGVLRPININRVDKLLTATMLNNYVKQRVVSPPKDKKYNEKHIAYLIVVCVLKQVFTLQDVCSLIKMQIETCEIDKAYNYFCNELETLLKAVFETRDFSEPSSINKTTYESEILRSTIMSFAHKIYIQKNLIEKYN